MFRTIDENATNNINRYGIKNSSYADIINAYKTGGVSGVKNSISSFITSKDLANIKEYNRLVSEEGVSSQTAYYKTMQTSSNVAKELFDDENNLTRVGDSIVLSQEAISTATNTMTLSAKAGQVALKGLAMAGNMLVSLGISAIISLAVKGLDNLVHTADNAKESAENFSNSFKSMNEEFTSNDSKLSDLQKQYDKLSKGVNSLGENVSLTTDEYDTYKKVISEISDMMPGLLARYDDEGNKIGFVQGKLKQRRVFTMPMLLCKSGSDIVKKLLTLLLQPPYHLHGNSSKPSTDDATKGVADDLQDLADKGELTIDTFRDTDGAENYFDNLGYSAEEAVKYIN